MRKLFGKRKTDQPRRRQDFSTDSRKTAEVQPKQYIFQRNRTLTGSTSSHLSGINRQDNLQSPRSQAHHLALKRRKIGVVFIAVLISGLFIFWLLTQFTASVTISVSDTSLSKKIDNQVYVKAVNDYLGAHPISRLRFALDKNNLRDYLVSTVPEVSDVVEVSLGAIGETNITLSMRRPVAGWTINSKQYFVDQDGVAYDRNYYANPTLQIVDNSGVALEQGEAVASNRFLGFVGRIVALSKQSNYTVVQAIIPSNTTRQLEIQLKEVGAHVRLSIDRPAGEQVEDMVKSLQYLAAHSLSPSYIDVRVSGKAFYK